MWTLTALAAFPLLVQAPAGDAREAVTAAALDYAESCYRREPQRIEHLAADAPRGVEVLDALDRIAAVRLTAWWGVDTLLCVRDDDGAWRIRSVLWQSVPG